MLAEIGRVRWKDYAHDKYMRWKSFNPKTQEQGGTCTQEEGAVLFIVSSKGRGMGRAKGVLTATAGHVQTGFILFECCKVTVSVL